jgi:ABC-type branched-subunit amino acid transport system substrate-binding protein
VTVSSGVARSFATVVAGALSASLFVVGATGTVSSGGCSSSSAGGGTGNQNPAGAPIVIGASIGLTGSLAGNSVAMQGGILAAVAQMNALGGILGRTVEVATEDDKSDPMQALSVAQTLVGQNVSALLGPIGSQQVSMVLPFISTSKVVEVSSTATSAQLTQQYPATQGFFFRTVPSDALQAVAVALFALEGPNVDAGAAACTKMVVVHNDDAYGNPLAAAIESYFKAHGGTIPGDGDIAVPENALSSYLSQVQQVIADVPQCIVLAVYPPTAAQFMHDLSDQIQMGSLPSGWSKGFFVIGTDGIYDPSLITDGRASASNPTSQSWVNGTYGPPVYGTVAYGSNHDRQQYNDLLALYSASVGLPSGMADMEPYTANQFDATVLTLLAMEAAGSSTNGPAIQQAMFNVSRGKSCSATPYGPLDLGDALSAVAAGGDINYQGASGDVDFDDYGDVVGDFLVWQVQGSSFVNHTVISSTKLATARSTADAGGCQE